MATKKQKKTPLKKATVKKTPAKKVVTKKELVKKAVFSKKPAKKSIVSKAVTNPLKEKTQVKQPKSLRMRHKILTGEGERRALLKQAQKSK